MATEWKVIEDNDEIIREFKGYKEGLVRYGEEGWVFVPKTAKMLENYKVENLLIYHIPSVISIILGNEDKR